MDVLDEKAEDEEIEEMIRLCSLEDNGKVYYEEFKKMVLGQNLAPIG